MSRKECSKRREWGEESHYSLGVVSKRFIEEVAKRIEGVRKHNLIDRAMKAMGGISKSLFPMWVA